MRQALPAAAQLYVATDGDDAAEGTITAPWRTVRHALSQLEGPGATIHLRGGTYAESGLALNISGTKNAPITIRGYADEVAVVDGGYSQFREQGNADWELVDPVKQIYRSVDSFTNAGQVYGFFGPGDGGWRLVPYEDVGPFTTDNEDFSDQPPYYYIGPGIYWDELDQRIYYRSQHSKYQLHDAQAMYRAATTQDVLVPADSHPGRTPMVIFGNAWIFDVEAGTHDIEFRNLVLRHQQNAVRIGEGAHRIALHDCDVLGGRYHLLVRDGAHDLLFDGITVHDRFPPWIGWSDIKLPTIGRPGRLFQGAAIELSGAVDGVEIANSSFLGVFGAVGATKTPSNLRVHHNEFAVADDVLQLGTAGWNIEFAYNVTLKARSGATAWSGSGAPPADKVGTVWVHHNVIDTVTAQRFGRSDPADLLAPKYDGPLGDGFTAGRPFGNHSSVLVTGPVPWKIYHNTCVFSDDASNGGAGQSYKFDFFDPSRPHEVYNNIFVQVADEWALRNPRVADGSQIHDGNLYWAPNRSPSTSLFEDVYDVYGGTPVHMPSLDYFKQTTYWLETTLHYPAGWEALGVEADPGFDEQLRPSANGPAATGAVDLSGKLWPGLAGEVFRGAIAP